jgi:hypothetical protein
MSSSSNSSEWIHASIYRAYTRAWTGAVRTCMHGVNSGKDVQYVESEGPEKVVRRESARAKFLSWSEKVVLGETHAID